MEREEKALSTTMTMEKEEKERVVKVERAIAVKEERVAAAKVATAAPRERGVKAVKEERAVKAVAAAARVARGAHPTLHCQVPCRPKLRARPHKMQHYIRRKPS